MRDSDRGGGRPGHREREREREIERESQDADYTREEARYREGLANVGN